MKVFPYLVTKSSILPHTFAQFVPNCTQTSIKYISAPMGRTADWNRFLDSWEQDGSNAGSYEKRLWVL